MTAIRLRLLAEARSRWRSWAGVALIVGLAAGAAVVGRAVAEAKGLEAGSALDLGFCQAGCGANPSYGFRIHFTVVGVEVAPGELASLTGGSLRAVYATPAFLKVYGDRLERSEGAM